MFCPYCGANLAEGAAFCSGCGKQLTAPANPTPTPTAAPNPQYPPQMTPEQTYQAQVYQAQMYQAQQMQSQQYQAQMYQAQQMQLEAQRNALRQTEIGILSRAYDYFNQRSDLYYAYDAACEKVNHYGPGAKAALLIWGAIICGIGAYLYIALAVAESFTPDYYIPEALFTFLPGSLMIVGGILLKLNCKKKLKQARESYSKTAEELYRFASAYPECPVGLEYTNPQILSALRKYIESGRADTVKESLNQVISGRCNSRMKDYAEDVSRHTTDLDVQSPIIFANPKML